MGKAKSDEQPVEELPGGEVGPPRLQEAFSVGRTNVKLAGQELVRAGALYAMIGIFVATLFLAFMHVGNSDWANTKELLQLLLPGETALLGSAFGFYFGTRAKDN
jgi:hypothetical protein